ncbi:hypothetical protein [Bradyrhizobium sp. USDA 3650]
MTDDGLYGDRLAKLFPMISEPSSSLVKSLQKGTFAAVRMAYSGPVGDPTLPSPPDEAFRTLPSAAVSESRVVAGWSIRT